MRHGQARPHHELHDEVAIADSIHAVLRDGLEAEILREEVTVQREAVTSEGAASEGKDGDARDQLLKALQICLEREGVR